MILSRYTINNIAGNLVQVPDAALFSLPEKVLQFGAGVQLRGIPDYFIDKANREGIFNGRIVVVNTTLPSQAAVFEKQDCLYTIGVQQEQASESLAHDSISAAISRVLNAAGEWPQVLECAHNPELKIIVSGSQEEDFSLVNDDIRLHPPKTFPGQLLSFLYERYRAFGGSTQSGMVIVPTELVAENGRKLETIVFELAHLNGLEDQFIEWLESCNQFCSSTLDGLAWEEPVATGQDPVRQKLGYTDHLYVTVGGQRSWVIEGNAQVKAVLSFWQADEAVIIAPVLAGALPAGAEKTTTQ